MNVAKKNLDLLVKINMEPSGQGTFLSRTCHYFSAKSSSIVTILASMSLTEQSFQINVQQYLGHKLSLVWNVGNNISLEEYRARKWKTGNTFSIEKCIERGFCLSAELETFCTDLNTEGWKTAYV